VNTLSDHLRQLIEQNGPLTIAAFMTEVLAHPTLGYYTRRDPLGAKGDFTTAPEISQVFGELIGLWLIDTWRHHGAPTSVILAELGPGRGTLMSDLLRATKSRRDFHDAIEIHLVEVSPALKEKQRVALSAYRVTWHETLSAVPTGKPLFVVANEFIDALPIRQFVRGAKAWHERCVGVDPDGNFAFGLTKGPIPSALIPLSLRTAPEGAVFEKRSAADAVIGDIAKRVTECGGAALIIDYGHGDHAVGDTLQAVKNHCYADPLSNPGEADLTAHVDFAALAVAAKENSAAVFGPVEQGQFLELLGVHVRGERLVAANPSRKSDILEGIKRLTAADQMGSLFKVMALLPKGVETPAGF
jgi:NADH dehydrogenase [ubiquinone] 1 alpha subcomplex assembly factor 7